jgi:hypothetical protein
VDLDFSEGKMKGVELIDCGADGIDARGSSVHLSGIRAVGVAGVAFSASAGSHFVIDDATSSQGGTALKGEGASFIELRRSSLESLEGEAIVEQGSRLSIDGVDVAPDSNRAPPS